MFLQSGIAVAIRLLSVELYNFLNTSYSDPCFILISKMNNSLITPLTERNYATWKVQIKMSLVKDDLWGFVDGTEVAPTDATALAKFNTRKNKALASIVLTIDPKILYLIGDPTDPASVFKKLQDTFQKKSWSNKFRLKQSLYNLRLSNDGGLQEHLRKMMNIFDEMAVVGNPVEDEDKVICLLSSLPGKFSTLVTALEASDTVPSWDSVVERLLHHESKRSLGHSNNDDNAMVVNRPNNHYNKFPKNNSGCFECGRQGHIRKNCYKFIAKQKKKSGDGTKPGASKVNVVENSRKDDVILYANNYAAFSRNIDKNCTWILDSGATQHMCNDKNFFSNFEEIEGTSLVEIGDGTPLVAQGRGDVILHMYLPNDSSRNVTLTNVLYLPDLKHNLVSISQCNANSKKTVFYENSCSIFSKDNDLIAYGKRSGKLYILDCAMSNLGSAQAAMRKPVSATLWHRRLAHISNHSLQKMVQNKIVDGIDCKDFSTDVICEDCCMGKNHRTPFPNHGKGKPREILELISSDVCGKITPASKGGAEYFVTFIDHATRYCWVYPIKTKDEVFDTFKVFKAEVENIYKSKIRFFRTDNGGEYCSHLFENFLKTHGIVHQKTVAKNPAQNGVSERRNRYLIETVRCMLSDADLSKEYWAEALATANYVHNRSFTSCLDVTPYEALNGHKPNLGHLRVFGSKCFAHIPCDERSKLDVKSKTSIFLGYGTNIKGYRLYDVSKHKIFHSRDVIFVECGRGIDVQKEQGRSPNIDPVQTSHGYPGNGVVELLDMQSVADNDSDHHNSDDDSSIDEIASDDESFEFYDSIAPDSPDPPVRRSTRSVNPPDRYGEWCSLATSLPEPTNVTEALAGREANLWLKAMQSELDAMRFNDVWKLVKPPPNTNIIKCKWVFKRKYDIAGNILGYKARLVGCGYSQKYGIDYDEIYSPVIRFESIRCILSLAVQHDLSVHAMDVSSAFLNSTLSEELYMSQPEHFHVKGKEDYVCKLNKAIYGLKQSSKCWNTSFSSTLLELNFKQSVNDSCVYTYFSNDVICIIGLYVDDLVIACNSAKFLSEIKNKLQSSYKMKDLGEIKQFLGVSIKRKDDKIFIDQSKFTQNLLEKFDFINSKSIATPVDISQKLSPTKENDVKFDKEKYQSAVGALLFLSTRTRPDISFAVSNVAKYASNPSIRHWQAIKRIFRYLNGTLNYGILYSKQNSECYGYSDADFAGDVSDRKSTSGYCFMFGGATVSWKSAKQQCVSLSTTESELVALSTATQEAIWLKKLLHDFHAGSDRPMLLYEDNQSALCLAKSSKGHGRAKHVDVKYFFVRDMIQSNKIVVEYCPTDNMLADIFTKGIPSERFVRLRTLLGVKTLT